RDIGPQGAAGGRSSARATENAPVVASLPASAGVEHARLRFPQCVETVFLQRIYVPFFISLATRRIEYVACTPNPDGAWVAQQARNLVMQLGEQQPFRFLVHDRDSKFSYAFDEVFRTEGARVIRTPVQAPNANAHAERCVRTIRSECLDWLLIFGRRQLERVLRTYVDHYNRQRPHRALDLDAPDPTRELAPPPLARPRT